jgi:hypothetical protein
MSNKLFLTGLAGAALAVTSLTNVASSQALPQSAVEVGGAVSFGTSIGGNYTGGANLSVTTPGSGGTATTDNVSTATPTGVSTSLAGEAKTDNGIESKGGVDTAVTFSPDGATATAGANAANVGGQGTALVGTNTATFSQAGLKLGSGQAGGSYGAISAGF